ncbi:MAG: FGGY-family carbohydrate kinase, partial [Pseudomonadota bacterium]
VEQLRIDGGMVVNDHLCQFLADLLNVPVERPVDVETTALGAAILAAVGAGLHADLAAAGSAWRLDRAFEPAMADARRQELLQDYAGAVRQVLAGLPDQ